MGVCHSNKNNFNDEPNDLLIRGRDPSPLPTTNKCGKNTLPNTFIEYVQSDDTIIISPVDVATLDYTYTEKELCLLQQMFRELAKRSPNNTMSLVTAFSSITYNNKSL